MAELRRSLGVRAAVVSLVLLAACDGDGDEDDAQSGARGDSATSESRIETFNVANRNHVQGPISYREKPPVGGDHNAVWQNCGFYSQPVEPERAVHSMEHGAVWVTHRPDLASAEVDALRQLARDNAYLLVSPWSDGSLPSPVVASAWGVQLKLSSATDPRLAEFVKMFAGRGNAPEPGGSCSGAVGTPG